MERTSSAKFVLQAWTVNTNKLSQLCPAAEDAEMCSLLMAPMCLFLPSYLKVPHSPSKLLCVV